MRPVGPELAIPASERPQTHALDRAASGIGPKYSIVSKKYLKEFFFSILSEVLHAKEIPFEMGLPDP
jgi:hypothetical protein